MEASDLSTVAVIADTLSKALDEIRRIQEKANNVKKAILSTEQPPKPIKSESQTAPPKDRFGSSKFRRTTPCVVIRGKSKDADEMNDFIIMDSEEERRRKRRRRSFSDSSDSVDEWKPVSRKSRRKSVLFAPKSPSLDYTSDFDIVESPEIFSEEEEEDSEDESPRARAKSIQPVTRIIPPVKRTVSETVISKKVFNIDDLPSHRTSGPFKIPRTVQRTVDSIPDVIYRMEEDHQLNLAELHGVELPKPVPEAPKVAEIPDSEDSGSEEEEEKVTKMRYGPNRTEIAIKGTKEMERTREFYGPTDEELARAKVEGHKMIKQCVAEEKPKKEQIWKDVYKWAKENGK